MGRSVNEVFEEINQLQATEATLAEKHPFERLSRLANTRLERATKQIKAAQSAVEKRRLVDRVNKEAREALQSASG
ncbi:hypothetical protein ACFL59_01005 [Planctomycetota bacterium]